MFVDSHCHLNFPQFAQDIGAFVKAARAVGVDFIQLVSTQTKAFPSIISIVSRFEGMFCSYGVHPCHVHEVDISILKVQIIESILSHPKIIGIGETGLDYYHSQDHNELQRYAFIEHIKAAQSSGLPLIVHTREAEDDTISILKSELFKKDFKILVHCFTGDVEFAKKCLDLGAYISFSGIVTYKNAKEIQEAAKFLPIERILIETDAPYLAPVPFRGKINEPSYVVHVAKAISELKGISLDSVAEFTTNNFFNLFSKAKR